MMKKYWSPNSKLLAVIFLLLIACNGIFVPDPIDPRIPKYTEEGNNVAGAMIDDNIWKSIVTSGFPHVIDEPLIAIRQEKDSLIIKFFGSTLGENSSLEFHLTGLNITKFGDLVVLEGKKIQLDGIKNAGYYIENDNPSGYNNRGFGQIYFKKVHLDSLSSKITLSGTFGFSINDLNGKAIKVSSGRFDYGITENSNFQIE